MTLSLRIASPIALCGALAWAANGARVPGGDKEFLLELSSSANIRFVNVRDDAAHIRVANAVGGQGDAQRFELEDWEFPLIAGEAATVASHKIVETVREDSTGTTREQPSSGDVTDWREWITDTMDGLARVSFSADGRRFLTVVREGNGITSGNVTTWVTDPSLAAGQMIRVDRLLHASISNDGKQVYVQTPEGLFVHAFETFGQEDPAQAIATTGEPHKIFSQVGPHGDGEPEYFFLVSKLSADLYSVARPKLPGGEFAPLEPLATLATNDYAVATDFDAETRLMIVVEANRARVARVGDAGREVLAEHRLEPGVEFRSCQPFRATDTAGTARSVFWAFGLRRNVVRPTATQVGSAEFAVTACALKEGTTQLQVLLSPDWRPCGRWNAYSPRIQFNKSGSELIAYTRDKAWTLEVAR